MPGFISPNAAAAAARGGVAQGQSADASAGRQQSSLSCHGQQQQQQTEAEVQATVRSWMQRVALLLSPTIPPACISLTELQRHEPIPQRVIDHHGGVKPTIQETLQPLGLCWMGLDNHVSIKRAEHLRLREAAEAAEAAAAEAADAAAAADGAGTPDAGLTSPLASRQAGLQSPAEQQQVWAAWQGNVAVAGPAATGFAPQDAAPAAAAPQLAAARSQGPGGRGGFLCDRSLGAAAAACQHRQPP